MLCKQYLDLVISRERLSRALMSPSKEDKTHLKAEYDKLQAVVQSARDEMGEHLKVLTPATKNRVTTFSRCLDVLPTLTIRIKTDGAKEKAKVALPFLIECFNQNNIQINMLQDEDYTTEFLIEAEWVVDQA